MKIVIPRERLEGELRVAATPDTVRKYRQRGIDVVVEAAAGIHCAIPDKEYEAAGATVTSDTADLYRGAAVVLKVRRPLRETADGIDEVAQLAPGSILVGLLDPYRNRDLLAALAERGITAFGLELVPRITRAQTMDVLSSQANLTGYRAVMDAAHEFGRAFPMMMTAAGTIAPARVMVMGAGVAGLQAIATARRLGAIVCATDVRPAAREQVQSLGATFVMIEDAETARAETSGGYAREMSTEYQAKQQALIAETLQKQDIVICTALIPGRPAPLLISAAMVARMKPGSVIVDLAVETGGNCELSRPGEVVVRDAVKIVGWENVASRIAVDASSMYARNLQSFLEVLLDPASGEPRLDSGDEILAATLLTRDGAVVHPAFAATLPSAVN